MRRVKQLVILGYLSVIAFAGTASIAQTENETDTAQTETETDTAQTATTSNGTELSSGFAGPSSVPSQLDAIDKARKKSGRNWPTFPSLDKYGLSLGADFQVLYQHATESLAENDAAGGVARFFGQWTPFRSGAADPGAFVFKVEDRRRLGTDIAPQALARAIGSAGLTAVPWSDAGGILTNLYWYQKFQNNRFSVLGGIIDVTDFVDVYGLFNPWTEFNNYAFSTNPTIPVPSQGLGGAARWSITPNIYIDGSIADANGDPSDPGDAIDSFFDTREYFKHLEFGWAGSWERRFEDNAHITAWHVDARQQAGVGSGRGMALSFSHLFSDRWMPFVRAGYSDGGGASFERLISTGLGYQLDESDHYVGVGASWGRPPTDTTGGNAVDQYTLEAYYRVQFFHHLQIVPSVQYIIDPAYNQSVDDLWVLSLRARATF